MCAVCVVDQTYATDRAVWYECQLIAGLFPQCIHLFMHVGSFEGFLTFSMSYQYLSYTGNMGS